MKTANSLSASATELSAAYHCSYRQVLRPAWIANVVSIQENIYMKRPPRYYIWKYGKKEPSFGTENQIQNSSKPCMVMDIPQWPQELLAHSLVATPLNLLKHQNCHPEFRPIMTESWMILVHRCIFRTILLQNSYMFTCDVQQKNPRRMSIPHISHHF